MLTQKPLDAEKQVHLLGRDKIDTDFKKQLQKNELECVCVHAHKYMHTLSPSFTSNPNINTINGSVPYKS